MPIPRYERELDDLASKRFTRWYVRLFLWAAVIGLLIGVGWTIAGLIYFHVLR